MAFYVKGNKQVAEYLGLKNNTGEDIIFLVSGSVILPYHVNDLHKMEVLKIPEYKLHPVHGLIPADSKLFLENHADSDKSADKTKEENENMKSKEIKKVFEVGDKCVIKNIDNQFYIPEEITEDFVDKEVTIVSKFTIPSNIEDSDIPMVSVMNENGQCTCFREELCYPIPTHKEKTLDKMKEVCSYKGSWSSLYQQFASDLYDAGLRFEDDVE